jgi:hypothetical protein
VGEDPQIPQEQPCDINVEWDSACGIIRKAEECGSRQVRKVAAMALVEEQAGLFLQKRKGTA